MYYVKIPLRYLCEPHELNVSEGDRDKVWAARVKSLIIDLRSGHLPSWAVSYKDLASVELLNDNAEPPRDTKGE
jgi:hypothetical protein